MNKTKTLKERVSELMIELGLDGSYYYVETLEAMKLYGKEVAKNVKHKAVDILNEETFVEDPDGVDKRNALRRIQNIQFSEIDPK